MASPETENPWLNIQSGSFSKITRKNNEIVIGKASGPAEKSKNRLRKHQEKHKSEREKAKDDAVVEISVDTILNLRSEESEQTNSPPVSTAKGAAQIVHDSDEDSAVNSEVEEQERRLTEKRRKGKGKAKDQGAVKPFAQRDLVSLAFAGDKVVQVRFPPYAGFKQAHYVRWFATRTFKRLNSERPSKTHRRKWIQHSLDGCGPFAIFAILTAPSRLNRYRVHGVGVAPRKRHRSHSSSRRSLGSTPSLEKIMERPTSSSPRNGTKKLPSIWSRSYRTHIQARRNTREACRRRLGRNGIPGLGSRGEHCRGWLRRCVIWVLPSHEYTLMMPISAWRRYRTSGQDNVVSFPPIGWRGPSLRHTHTHVCIHMA